MLESPDLSEAYLEHLIENDVIDAVDAVRILDAQRQQTPQIGRISLLKGYLSMKQVFEILKTQVDTGLRFGEQAILLGFLDDHQLVELLEEQKCSRPGIGEIVYKLGYARKGILQKSRRTFMRELESMLA